MRTPVRQLLTAAVLAVVVLAGCEVDDGEPVLTATTPPAVTVTSTTRAPAPAATCPLGRRACPNPHLTPGQVDPDAAEVVPPGSPAAGLPEACVVGGPGRDPRRGISDADWDTVLAGYGLTRASRVAEKDHLISYWAGGTSTPLNVWPQLDDAAKRRKDAYEASLWHDVCVERSLGIRAAWDRLRHFWLWW